MSLIYNNHDAFRLEQNVLWRRRFGCTYIENGYSGRTLVIIESYGIIKETTKLINDRKYLYEYIFVLLVGISVRIDIYHIISTICYP